MYSTRNVDHVRGLGADHVIDHTRTDSSASGHRYDFILDNVEARPPSATLRVLARGGTLVTNSGSGHRIFGPLGRMVRELVATASTPATVERFLYRRSLDDRAPAHPAAPSATGGRRTRTPAAVGG